MTHSQATRAPNLDVLFKTQISFPNAPSPAAVHSCRVAVQDNQSELSSCAAFVASATDVYKVKIPRVNGMPVVQGKEGVYIPIFAPNADSVRVCQIAHNAEVQSVALHCADEHTILATVDSHGRTVIALFDGCEDTVKSSYVLTPANNYEGEAGWAGAAVHAAQPSTIGVVRHFAKDVTLYDGEVVLRQLHTLHPPTSLSFLPPGAGGAEQLLAVTEGHQVSLWDHRVGEGGGCVQRLGLGGEPLYCTAWCTADGGFLAAAGAERAVTLLEPRRWKVHAKWAGAARCDIYTLNFCRCNPRYAVISGFDYELVCGRWDGSEVSRMAGVKRAVGPEPLDRDHDAYRPVNGLSFRGDSRWMGVAKGPNTDTVMGLGESGYLFVAQLNSMGSPQSGL